MGNRRTAKVAEAIREVVSSTILFELRDPRIQHVTVLSVEVPNDLRTAKVHVSVMGDESQQRLTMGGLDAARGFLQGKVGDRVNLRFTPILSFELDEGVKKSVEASRILRQLAEEREAEAQAAGERGEVAVPVSGSSTGLDSSSVSDSSSGEGDGAARLCGSSEIEMPDESGPPPVIPERAEES